jgi:hypothetical protein
VSFIGTYSSESHSWQWAWANESIDENCYEKTLQIKGLGEKNNISDLHENDWVCEAQDAWAMAALSCKLLEGVGVFCAETDTGSMFLVLHKIDMMDE